MNLALSKPGVRRGVLLLVWCLFAAPFATAQSSHLDKYGGAKALKCAKAIGWFHTEKINSHWWLCTPLGNAFYPLGVQQAPGTIHGTWDPASVNKRMQSWGFNTVYIGSYLCDLPVCIDSPFPLDSNGLHTNPVKMPFIINERPALYAMENTRIGALPYLTNPVKNMISVHSPFYTGFVPAPTADYYDSGIGTWLHDDLTAGDDIYVQMLNGPGSIYQNYMIGWASDDGDEMFGFGAGPDFPTVPAGHTNYNLGLQVAAMSPLQTANPTIAYGGGGFVYADTLIHSKKALRDALVSKYTTISALNSAWGSSYTTFDSSGVCVGGQPITCASSAAADPVGTGNGSTLTFSTTLSTATISAFSLQILVAGTPVAGDLGNGTLYGPNASGTINYSTKAVSVTFTAGHAPASSAAITATYVANGWGIGTGLLDEDNRTAHNSYMGTDWIYMSNANANVKTDMNSFLGALAGQYFSTCRTQFKAVFPNIMYLGPDSLISYGVPSAAPVMQAAGQYIDMFITSNSTAFTQAMMDYMETNWGDKPYIGSFYSIANPDSAMSAGANLTPPTGFSTQAARGAAYVSIMNSQLTTHTTAGNYPEIGSVWFEYTDLPGFVQNWGLTTPSDNAYDGHEAATGSVPCSAPLQAYTCGSEPMPSGGGVPPFGNLITYVKTANLSWLSIDP